MQENILEIDRGGKNGTELVAGLWSLEETPKTLQQQQGTGWLSHS